MIIVHLKRGGSIEVPGGAAVAASTFPAQPGTQTPAASLNVVSPDGRVLASFRVAEVAGYDLSRAGA
jgi:hypothetical protein